METSKTMNSKTVIQVKNLSKIYQLGKIEVPALTEVSLDIYEGDMVCIMGKSGSGKSTLLHQLGLIDTPTSGSIHIAGQDVSKFSENKKNDLRLRKLGYVFQEYALLPELTALENVYLPGLMRGAKKSEYTKKAHELLNTVGLGGREKHRPNELSGGEQQRVAIARSLINTPEIIYADEPTANLDTVSSETIMTTLHDLNKKLGVTILFVSHDPDDKKFAKRTINLQDGKIKNDDK